MQMAANKSLKQWLQQLELRHPVAIDLGLDRIAEVNRRLGSLRPAPRVITVGGTNGKGSCVTLLQRLCSAAGYRVGAYTSPHLLRFNERISIAGQLVSDKQLCDAFAQIEAARGHISLSYFEFTTLAAFITMAQSNLDIAVLEVGLGGRLDAVNLIEPDVSVITSIDLDHRDWLGDTREQVAIEKLGIARRNRPLVCGEVNRPVNMEAEIRSIGAVAYHRGDHFQLAAQGHEVAGWVTDKNGKRNDYVSLPGPQLPLLSVACALQAAKLLDIRLTCAQIGEVFAGTSLTGRFQKCEHRGVQVILDVAHNPAAAAHLATRLSREGGTPCLAVVAMMRDKDITGIIEALQAQVSHWFVGDLPGLPRAAPAAELARLLYNAHAVVSTAQSVVDALILALDSAQSGQVVLVCGSFYTVAAALEWMENERGGT